MLRARRTKLDAAKGILKGVCGGYLLGQMDYLSTVSQVRGKSYGDCE